MVITSLKELCNDVIKSYQINKKVSRKRAWNGFKNEPDLSGAPWDTPRETPHFEQGGIKGEGAVPTQSPTQAFLTNLSL